MPRLLQARAKPATFFAMQPAFRFFFHFLAAFGMLAASAWPQASQARVVAVDDAKHQVRLAQPARRIISLAPHATELLFAAGAGAYLVAVSDYSNFPPQVLRLPSVGSSAAVDMERIAALKPDLVVAWGSGNSAAQIAKLRRLGMAVFESEPRDYEGIASTIERLAHLSGTKSIGAEAAAKFRQQLKDIAANYADRPPVRVFYQIWREPLMTLNDRHMVSQALRLCGGKNVFGGLPQLAPTVGIEAVIEANPEVIIANNSENTGPGWRRFPGMTAVMRDNLFALDADLLTRAGPRILDGTEILCRHLETARKKRP